MSGHAAIVVGFEVSAFWLGYSALLLAASIWRDDARLINDAAEAAAWGVILALAMLAVCGFPAGCTAPGLRQ